jgi:sterol desaturase/sphingolipid hydroxylase (fatty acid hydroxylase superfamily)
MSTSQIPVLLVIAVLGHAMAFFWLLALRRRWKICDRTIYDLPINEKQLRREQKNSIHTPVHALILAACAYLGFFQNTTWLSFCLSALTTTAWAEIWHYASHRAFHLKALHWIHAEHHKSHLNTPFTAISFSFSEKLIFDLGLLLPLVALDAVVSFNFYGVAAWYIGYLVINSFSHANFELKSQKYNKVFGRVLTTTTYHSLHHSRYTGNYGLGTRVLDRMFGTEWDDYEQLYERVTGERRPLTGLRERVTP